MNIRKNRSFIVKLLPAALLAILLGGCNNITMERPSGESPDGSALVQVIIDAGNGPAENQARTVVPTDPDFIYTLTFTATGKTPVVVENAGVNETVSLETGTWTLKVEGTKEGDRAAESETIAVVVASAEGAVQTVPVTVHPVLSGPEGSFEYDISFDTTMEISSALLSLTPLSDGGSEREPIDVLTDGEGSVDLKPGYYRLQVRVTQNNGVLTSRREIVHIYSHTATAKAYNFGSGDFTGSKYLAGTVDKGTFTAFTPVMVYAYGETELGSGAVSGNAWDMVIEGTPETVHFKVKLTKDGIGEYYGKLEEVTDIPLAGKSDIGLTVRGYTVQVAETVTGGGTIEGIPAGGQALPGEILTLNPSPDGNYEFVSGSFKINGDALAPPYIYAMPEADLEIEAMFSELLFQAVWHVSSGGDDNNDGYSMERSLATVSKALDLIKTTYNGGAEWPASQSVKIIIAGTITAASSVSNGMVEISGTNAYPPIELRGLREGTPGTLNANNQGRVLYIGDNNAVTLGNYLTLTRGSSSAGGGGVYVSSGTFTLAGGKILGNMTTSRYGGGVYVESSGTFTMTSGEISGNTISVSGSGSYGGGVYVAGSGTFTLAGGKISDNTADSSSYSYGGGVYVSSGTFTMTGGEISGNTAYTYSYAYGGGVYVSSGTFTMNSGEISGNTASANSSESSYGGGVYVGSGTFTLAGGKILDNTAYSASSYSYGGGVYVPSSGTFTMNSGEISGNTASASSSSYAAYGGGVYSSGRFTLAGGEISGNTASTTSDSYSYGGGVYVYSGTFTMEGGEISGNAASARYSYSYGGGVYVYSGTFTMNSGEISGNTASAYSYSYGGGVYVYSGTFTMNSGEISGNTASASRYASYGGGVYVESSGTFNLYGGEISGNTASGGGGVFVESSGTFTMTGGEISGNTASVGGGVYVESSGTFKKQPRGSSTSGTIYGYTVGDNKSNRASGSGHAVYINSYQKRETTVTETQRLDSALSGAAGGWTD